MDEPRNTDNAWFETTACHFHCSRELGALLPLKPAPANLTVEQQGLLEDYHSNKPQSKEWRQLVREDLGLNDIFWLDVEEAAGDKDIYASHRDWINLVRDRLKQLDTHPGLLQLVAQWGRVDVLEDVLKDPDLLAQRQPMQVQMAFQGALEHAIEPSFDLGLIELLMERGAKAAEVYLPALFDLKGRDRFGLFAGIQHRRVRRRPSRVKAVLLARSLWRGVHIGFMQKFIEGFENYAREQPALHNVDLMFWAITAGALDLAELFWRRCRSPIRAALIAQAMLVKIRLKGREVAALEESVALFSRHAVGVLEHLPDQETTRLLLLSKVGDFATLGSTGSLEESLLDVAISLGNNDFVSQRSCQDILDEMWWGRSPRSGRVWLQKPWPSRFGVYAQVLLPFIRILRFVPNDLCVGYPWMTDKQLRGSGGEKRVHVEWWRAMLAIWHIPVVKKHLDDIN